MTSGGFRLNSCSISSFSDRICLSQLASFTKMSIPNSTFLKGVGLFVIIVGLVEVSAQILWDANTWQYCGKSIGRNDWDLLLDSFTHLGLLFDYSDWYWCRSVGLRSRKQVRLLVGCHDRCGVWYHCRHCQQQVRLFSISLCPLRL